MWCWEVWCILILHSSRFAIIFFSSTFPVAFCILMRLTPSDCSTCGPSSETLFMGEECIMPTVDQWPLVKRLIFEYLGRYYIIILLARDRSKLVDLWSSLKKRPIRFIKPGLALVRTTAAGTRPRPFRACSMFFCAHNESCFCKTRDGPFNLEGCYLSRTM